MPVPVVRAFASPGRRVIAPLAVVALVVAGGITASQAQAASVTSAAFSGGTGTYTGTGTLYAKAGATLTLTVTTDSTTQCVDVVDGTGATIATQTSNNPKTSWSFSGTGYSFLTAPSGNGTLTYTTKAWKGVNGNGKCTANGGESFGIQSASYTLDNTAPTATAALSPAANAAGWNKANVALTWSATDTGGSGVKTVSPTTDTVNAEGITTRTTTVTDNLGNTGTGSVQVKLDKTAPTIVGSRTPAANANGWNNSDVTVSFTTGDTPSGVKTTTGPTTLTTSAANQSVTGTVTDNADNTASATVSGINIDKVAPTLSGAPTTSPNAAGWYRGNVTVAWTATDALSGTTTPANSTITGEGTALTASTSVTDKAGNTSGSVASTPAVKIDRTAPTTTVTAPPAWNKSDVTLTLVPNDGLSGVAGTFYKLDNGPQTAGTSVPVTAEGNHTLTFWSTDVAGNTETSRSVTFGIDKTSPMIGHIQSPAANADGWNRSDVTVTFACSDALSGVASCTGPQTVTTEGKAQAVTGTVTDNAGNSATDPASVSIDKAKPVLSMYPMPEPNPYGWFSDEVVAAFSASDILSGVNASDLGHRFYEGAGQTFTATATDTAGNTSSLSTPVVNVDKTDPTIKGTVVTVPNANGWFSGDVTVHWTCADNLSGVVSCPADSVVTGEGSNRSASASVTDKAGHTATATVDGIRIDRTAPSTTADGVPSGWVNAPVTLALHATDNLSGAEHTYYAIDGATTPVEGDQVTIGIQGAHIVSFWSVDAAGNREAAQSVTVSLDLTSPDIEAGQSPAQNDGGWNNSNVTVSFACADQITLSGLRSCTDPVVVSTEGKAQLVTGRATDNAGNHTDATATVNLDKTPPTITGAPDRAANAADWYADDVTVSFTAGDTLSGIDTVTPPAHLGEGAGQHATGQATDNAGNSAWSTVDGINVDKTPPSLSAAPTTAPNANGWYNADVTQAWSADDNLSGLAGSVPSNSVLTQEGQGRTASASVSDNAGNTTTATSAPVKIDKTAPTTDISAPSGWVNGSATVSFKAHDGLSGVSSTHYRLDGGSEQVGSSLDITSEGTHTVTYWSGDLAGNVEDQHTATVQIDQTAPTITHTLSPVANANGWNRTDVTVTFTCADQDTLSGVASCTAPVTQTAEVTGKTVTGTATDNAGNSATDVATVNVDRTAPTISGSRTPAANDYGWNNTDVTVHFTGADERSGLASVSNDTTLGEGTNQSVDGTAKDGAGNSATATVSGINVDETAPTLSGGPTSDANGHGWYRDDVTIAWLAGDDRSAIVATPGNSVITGEGEGLRATATVHDKAGNATTSDSVPVGIDRTAPVTGAAAPSGWSNQAVTLSLEPSDALSGVVATYSSLDAGAARPGTTVTVSTEGIHTLKYWSVDGAGNVEAAHSATVKVDLTLPTVGHTVVPAPNVAGWNNTPVTVSYSCTDDMSGVASCASDVAVATDGDGQTVAGTAKDNAGNARTDIATVSIDTVKPTVTGSADRSANDNGWYAGNVTVGFDCDDALSGVATCSAPVTLGEGKAQAATGTAVDAAGNSATATVSPVNVDKTAPKLSGAPTTDPNGNGWYRGDVAVRWTASDALSGIDGSIPADDTITGEGTGLTASASVRDLAGNATSAATAAVKIDRTAPVTTVSDVSDWSNAAVTVRLSAADSRSGVASTSYQLDDKPVAAGTSLTIGTEGVHTLQVWSVDKAGNEEAHKNIEVKIDLTAPGISHTQEPAANGRSWNNTSVTVTFTCTDSGSGIASCTSPVTKGEGGAQSVEGKATDKAGNFGTDVATVNVDKTKPTLTAELSAAPNAFGWFKAPVTATFTCEDQKGLSGVLSCPDPQTKGEGANQSFSGAAFDGADNVSDPRVVTGINVDTTAPTLSGAATTVPNGNGWYRGDVSVHWTASDGLSGLDGPAPADSVVTGEGRTLSASASVNDKAGNTSVATVGGIKIDRNSPLTTANAPAAWQKSDVVVTLTATDGLSGVAVTRYTVDGGSTQDGTTVTVSAEGVHTIAYWSVDNAGNAESKSSVKVQVDKTPPTITGAPTTSPNANGWYASAVTVRFSCADTLSGLAGCQPDATVAAEGTNSTSGTAVDNAGNTATTTVTGIKVDTVKPSLTVTGISEGAEYILGAVPAPVLTASDANSGLAAPASGSLSGGTGTGVGAFTYTATVTDRAGNTQSVTVRYRVAYGIGTTLFLQPVNDTAHQTGLATSVFNAGQTVPMKFTVQNAAGQVVQTSAAPAWLTPVKGGSTTAAVNEAAYTDPATAGGVYTWDGSKYQFNWKTDKSQAGSYWRVGVTLDDGHTYTVNVGLR